MKIITGDEFGLIKLISTQTKHVLDQYGTIDSSKSILNIFSNNKIETKKENNNNSESNDDEEEEVEENEKEQNLDLFVSSIYENYILNWNSKNIIGSYKNDNPNTSFISSAIKFPKLNNDNTIFINATSDDRINVVSFNNENKFLNSKIFWPVDNSNKFLKIKLRGISNSIYNNNESVYCLYQNTPIVLYNIEQQKIEFKGKNLPNDELGLKIPIYDTDVIEIKNNPRLNYVSTAYGEIRFYDKKASPKPSMNKKITKSKINKIDITEDNNYLFVGDNQGYCAMLDIRKNFTPCKTFKGNTGSIKSLINVEKNNNLIVAGFDRYVRWYDYKSGNNDKIFVKNKTNCSILIGFEPEKKMNFEEEEESEIDDSDILDEESEENEDEEEEENGEDESSDEKKENLKENKLKKEKILKNKKEENEIEDSEEIGEEEEDEENRNEKIKNKEKNNKKNKKEDMNKGIKKGNKEEESEQSNEQHFEEIIENDEFEDDDEDEDDEDEDEDDDEDEVDDDEDIDEEEEEEEEENDKGNEESENDRKIKRKDIKTKKDKYNSQSINKNKKKRLN